MNCEKGTSAVVVEASRSKYSHLEVLVDGASLFEHPAFPVRDLASQLAAWLSVVDDETCPDAFVFWREGQPEWTGMFRVEPRLGGWQFTSTAEKRRHLRMLSLDEWRSILGAFAVHEP